MTNTIWGSAVSANWTTVADWTGGVPTAGVDAVINTNGAYTVTLSSAGNAHSLTMDAVGATLLETASGSLTLAGGLTVDAGTVILNGASLATTRLRAEQFRQSVEQMGVRYRDRILKFTVSIGIAAYPEDGNQLADVLHAADAALYFAKNHGRNQVASAANMREAATPS